jgi:hypothetical protein
MRFENLSGLKHSHDCNEYENRNDCNTGLQTSAECRIMMMMIIIIIIIFIAAVV